MKSSYDFMIIGGGIYGLYAAIALQGKYNVLLIEKEDDFFKKASFVNQARLHNGYHYPRSVETAKLSHRYYDRFCQEFESSIYNKFSQIYAVSKESRVSACQYEKFCGEVDIPIRQISNDIYFNPDVVESTYLTEECAFDYIAVKKQMLEHCKCDTVLNTTITRVWEKSDRWEVSLNNSVPIEAGNIINCTYASINQVNRIFQKPSIDLKYELCEMILCNVQQDFDNVGITVMDGHFFSIMPFGLQGFYSLSSVKFTPHHESTDILPKFPCQVNSDECSRLQLGDCNNCKGCPSTSFSEMKCLADRYLKFNKVEMRESIFAVKTLMQAAETDDARLVHPVIHNETPFLASIFSGKINCIYEIDKLLKPFLEDC